METLSNLRTGVVLNQSPVALAAYILEKFSTWTHRDNPLLPDGGLLSQNFPFTMDSLLDNICVYWLVTPTLNHTGGDNNKNVLHAHQYQVPYSSIQCECVFCLCSMCTVHYYNCKCVLIRSVKSRV